MLKYQSDTCNVKKKGWISIILIFLLKYINFELNFKLDGIVLEQLPVTTEKSNL